MTLLDNIKAGMKFIKANFQFGEEVEELQKERLHICKTSGQNGEPCHNFELFPTPLGYRPRCCSFDLPGCAPHQNGCKCWITSKAKDQEELCPLGKW